MMNRILLSMLCVSGVAHAVPAYWQDAPKLLYEKLQKISQEKPYNKTDFAAQLNEQNQKDPQFIAKFNCHTADLGVIVRKRALFDTLFGAACIASLGGMLVASNAISGQSHDLAPAIGLVAAGTCLAAGIIAYIHTSIDLNYMYQHRMDASLDPAAVMAITWAKHNKWATLFASSKNDSATFRHNHLIADMKKKMQEDLQFEQEFMDQLTTIGNSAWNNKAISFRNSMQAAPWIVPCGALVGALIGAGMGKKDIPTSIKAAAGGAIGTLIAAACTVPSGILFGAVDNIQDICARIDEDSRTESMHNRHLTDAQVYATTACNIFYGIDPTTIYTYGRKLKPTTTPHRAANWAKKHPWLTLATVVSNKPAHKKFHAELDRVNPADFGL